MAHRSKGGATYRRNQGAEFEIGFIDASASKKQSCSSLTHFAIACTMRPSSFRRLPSQVIAPLFATLPRLEPVVFCGDEAFETGFVFVIVC
jgi:hypothetical protein